MPSTTSSSPLEKGCNLPSYNYLKYYLTIKGCPILTQWPSLLRPWRSGRVSQKEACLVSLSKEVFLLQMQGTGLSRMISGTQQLKLIADGVRISIKDAGLTKHELHEKDLNCSWFVRFKMLSVDCLVDCLHPVQVNSLGTIFPAQWPIRANNSNTSVWIVDKGGKMFS